MRGLIAVLVALSVWQGVVWASGVPPFILPGPARVAQALIDHAAMLAVNARFTLANLAAGLAVGVALGVGTAVNLALSPAARWLLRPMLIAAQAVPVFALAPILTLWLGYGAPSKVVMVALVVYFPVASVL
uniref:ABC transporter permease n=1 Tax=Paracoccus sp. TaxID=267 RepID=UPI003FA77D05